MRSRTFALSLGAIVFASGVLFLATRPMPAKVDPSNAVSTRLPKVPGVSQPRALEEFVARHALSKDPDVRDRVGAARLRQGYAVARTAGYAKARESFLLTAKEHKGTGAQSAGFGGVADQAAYQAIACLVGEGKSEVAKGEFERFMKDRPLSPLVHASYRRLKKLNGGESKPEWDRLLQSAVALQEKRIRFETSVCGPKCLERIVGKDYKTLAKLCGTKDSGTTVEGMRKGLKSMGKESWAVVLSRPDLAKAALPAVLLRGDHYVVLERLGKDYATVWDPRYSNSSTMKLPSIDDPDFTATLIVLSRPEGL